MRASLLPIRKLRKLWFLYVFTLFVATCIMIYRSVWTQRQPVLCQESKVEYDLADEPIFNASTSAVGVFYPPDSRPPITLVKGFIIENQDLCSTYLSLTYIVVVHTAPSHFEMRQSLRKTWANAGMGFNGVHGLTIFLLGRTSNGILQQQLLLENKKTRDIVQGDFIDDYKNLTLKAVMGLKWITKNCANAEYVIKVDDDVFVNIFQVIKTVFPELKANPKQVYCSVEPEPIIFRESEEHDINDKWKVSNKFFKNLENYPMPFCYGYATFYTTILATELLRMAASTPFYRLDDIYVYGILVSKVHGASWRNGEKRYFNNEDNTLKLFWRTESSLVGTVFSSAAMQHMWYFVLDYQTLCER